MYGTGNVVDTATDVYKHSADDRVFDYVRMCVYVLLQNPRRKKQIKPINYYINGVIIVLPTTDNAWIKCVIFRVLRQVISCASTCIIIIIHIMWMRRVKALEKKKK